MTAVNDAWSIEDSANAYRMDEWGAGYFGISPQGTLQVLPEKDLGGSLDLMEIVTGLAARGLEAPIVLRFPDLLQHRMRELAAAFRRAMEEEQYTGPYSCVYPIKVNQQRHLCQQVCEMAEELGFGIEVGSKPELLAGLALTVGRNGMPVVCNGFKDEEFIETVVLAAKMGRNMLPVVEQFHELELLTRHARAHSVEPSIGIRAKLAAGGIGRWASTSGVRGKFGLSVTEILAAVSFLRDEGLLDSLRMLHCHIGSQVYDIRTVKYAVSEVAHLYVELVRLGAPLGILDIGGGLGVDYDGTQSASESSANYTVDQYALDVVHRIRAICDDAGVAHPHLMTESGRALVAHSSALICEVVGSRVAPDRPVEILLEEATRSDPVPQPLEDMIGAYERLGEADPIELFHDASHAMDEAASLFNLGFMDLTSRAVTEELYWRLSRTVVDMLGSDLPEELEALDDKLGDLYFVNLSVFQSLLDSWGIGQVFPVMPIHRLDERPTHHGILVDITCDSEGRIERFPGPEGTKSTLDLHALIPSDRGPDTASRFAPYYLGVFLTGAYQETLGDLHNLFGDTHVAHVTLGPDGRWKIDQLVEGDTVEKVLGYVQYDVKAMREDLRNDTEAAVDSGRLTLPEAVSLRRFLDDGLLGYTYLE